MNKFFRTTYEFMMNFRTTYYKNTKKWQVTKNLKKNERFFKTDNVFRLRCKAENDQNNTILLFTLSNRAVTE